MASQEPFAEAIEQVIATLDALWELLAPEGPNQMVEDLRFAAFVEHLASVALSDLHPIKPGDKESLRTLATISEFSLNRQLDEIQMDGVAVCTQFRTAIPRKVVSLNVEGSRSWPVYLVRAGTDDLDTLLGENLATVVVERSETQEPPQEAPPGETTPSPPEGGEEMPEESSRPSEAATPRTTDQGAAPGEEGALAGDLFLACQSRGFPIEEPAQNAIVIGPSLLAVSMEMRAGGSIRPIEFALDDLAREVGVSSISVENDPYRPFHVRFLIARPNRRFPDLTQSSPDLANESSLSYLGLFLGQTLEGDDFQSYVSGWPHMLIGGTTGSGKTTFIRSILRQIGRVDSRYAKVVVIDGKGDVDYLNVVPETHFVSEFPEVLLGHAHANEVLDWLVDKEIPRRRELIVSNAKGASDRPLSARESFIRSAVAGQDPDPFPMVLLVVDEFADIMLSNRSAASQFEQRVQQVAQVGRSFLVHVALATQRPDANVVRGAIKANLDARVALRLPTHHDSMTILGGKGAERLLGNGDLIFRSAGQSPVRLQGYNA